MTGELLEGYLILDGKLTISRGPMSLGVPENTSDWSTHLPSLPRRTTAMASFYPKQTEGATGDVLNRMEAENPKRQKSKMVQVKIEIYVPNLDGFMWWKS